MNESRTIPATETTPEISFDYDSNTFEFSGESFPENVKEFYRPITAELSEYLAAQKGATICFIFNFRYFHSGTARTLLSIFGDLEDCAEAGNAVEIVWRFDEDDDNMEEFGEEFSEDFSAVNFRMDPQPAGGS